MPIIHLLLLVLAAVSGGPTIKSVSVAGPIVGSNNASGRIELTRPAIEPVVITLVTNNPRLATAPANVTIASGQSAGTFTVKTEPVATLTTFTLTARMTGSPDASTTFTLTPPALTDLDCEPTKVSGGSHASCKASMDGPVAAGAAPQIAVSTSNSQIISVSPSTVTVPSGSRFVTFDVRANDLPQSASAKISASYAGVTKTSSLTVTPAAISSFGCAMAKDLPQKTQCSVVGGQFSPPGPPVWFIVRITAPAPPAGYEIPLTLAVTDANGKPLPVPPWMNLIHLGMKVPAGKTEAFYPIYTKPVESIGVIKVTVRDPMTHNTFDTELTVHPPTIRSVLLQPNTLLAVPLGGKEADVYVMFESPPPSSGIAYDVTYGGTTDIKGPARVRIGGNHSTEFKVKIFPCALSPPCHVSVTVGDKSATATVTP